MLRQCFNKCIYFFHSSHSLLICCPDYWTDDVVAFIPEVHQQYNQELLLPLTNFCYRFS
nr:MAG TPA: hypothetical protein [Caudoviricetes sp.]